MAPRALQVKSMWGTYSVFYTLAEKFTQIILVIAFENVQILYAELLIFVPTKFESCPVEPWGIEKVVDAFIVDL